MGEKEREGKEEERERRSGREEEREGRNEKKRKGVEMSESTKIK